MKKDNEQKTYVCPKIIIDEKKLFMAGKSGVIIQEDLDLFLKKQAYDKFKNQNRN